MQFTCRRQHTTLLTGFAFEDRTRVGRQRLCASCQPTARRLSITMRRWPAILDNRARFTAAVLRACGVKVIPKPRRSRGGKGGRPRRFRRISPLWAWRMIVVASTLCSQEPARPDRLFLVRTEHLYAGRRPAEACRTTMPPSGLDILSGRSEWTVTVISDVKALTGRHRVRCRLMRARRATQEMDVLNLAETECWR
jgi:hypothetical protein